MIFEILMNEFVSMVNDGAVAFAYRDDNGHNQAVIGTAYAGLTKGTHPGLYGHNPEEFYFFNLLTNKWNSFKPKNLVWVETVGSIGVSPVEEEFFNTWLLTATDYLDK